MGSIAGVLLEQMMLGLIILYYMLSSTAMAVALDVLCLPCAEVRIKAVVGCHAARLLLSMLLESCSWPQCSPQLVAHGAASSGCGVR